MSQRRPCTDGLPLLNGALLLEYNRHQRMTKSLGSRAVREKIVKEKDRNHKVPPSKFGERCAFHADPLDFYCHTHKEPACIVCATTMHKVCHVVTVSENATKSHHACVNISDIEQTIEVVIDNIEKIRVDREENLTEILLQKNAVEKDLHIIRKKLNERLDRIEKDLLSQLNDSFIKHKVETEMLLRDLENRKQVAKSLQIAITKVKNINSDVEAFMEGKRIEKKVHQEETHISNYYYDQNIKYITLEFKLNPLINSFIADLKSFGDLTLRKSPSRVNFTRVVHKVNQQITGWQFAGHISHIKLRLQKKTYNATGIHDIRDLSTISVALNRQKTM